MKLFFNPTPRRRTTLRDQLLLIRTSDFCFNITPQKKKNHFCPHDPLLSAADFELCCLQRLVTKQDGGKISHLSSFASCVESSHPAEVDLGKARGCGCTRSLLPAWWCVLFPETRRDWIQAGYCARFTKSASFIPRPMAVVLILSFSSCQNIKQKRWLRCVCVWEQQLLSKLDVSGTSNTRIRGEVHRDYKCVSQGRARLAGTVREKNKQISKIQNIHSLKEQFFISDPEPETFLLFQGDSCTWGKIYFSKADAWY